MTEAARKPPAPAISLASDTVRRFQQFHSGEPLNDELRRARDGDFALTEAAKPTAGPAPHPTEVAGRKLTRADRTLLREIRAHEGWPVVMRLLGNKLAVMREHAITNSQNDPLRNRDIIAEGWAQLKLAERFVNSIEGEIERELGELVKQEEHAK